MSNPRDLAHVRACLDDPFTPHLLALADWHEEAGQGALARAYRRIAREGKVPDVGGKGWFWQDNSTWPAARYSVPSGTHRCATQRLYVMRTDYQGEATLSQAYHALALAYAEEEGP